MQDNERGCKSIVHLYIRDHEGIFVNLIISCLFKFVYFRYFISFLDNISHKHFDGLLYKVITRKIEMP